MVQWCANATNSADDAFRVLFSMILQVPLCMIMNLFISENQGARLVYNLAAGLYVHFYMFGWEAYHGFIISTVAYLVMMFAPRDLQHKINMFWCLGYLSAQHIYR